MSENSAHHSVDGTPQPGHVDKLHHVEHSEAEGDRPPPPPPPRQAAPATHEPNSPSPPPSQPPPMNSQGANPPPQQPPVSTINQTAPPQRPPPQISTNITAPSVHSTPPPPPRAANEKALSTRPPPPIPPTNQDSALTLNLPSGHPGGAQAASVSPSPEPEHCPTLVVCEPYSRQPDTPENVEREAEQIFTSFVIEQISIDQERHVIPESTPPVHLAEQRRNPLSLDPIRTNNSVEAQIGRQLAFLGDDINRRYNTQFEQMLTLFNPTDDDAFDNFCKVAHELFRDGEINWGRIVALFFFGYRIAVVRILGGMDDFLTRVVRWFVDFLRFERVIQWVAEQGGWRVVLHLMYDHMTSTPVVAAVSTAGICVLIAFFLRFISRR